MTKKKIRLTKKIASKRKKLTKAEKKQKKLIFVIGLIQLIKIIVIAGFLIYIYFWIKARS